MAYRTCTVDGCERPARSPKATLCNTHYFRWWRRGDVGVAEIWDRKRRPCPVDGCDRLCDIRGFCLLHYRRFVSHGDPTLVADQSGPANPFWRGDRVTYGGAHDRLRGARGSVRDHTCACGSPARQWAYDHLDPNEKQSPLGAYSTDFSHYTAMCISCHKRYDLAVIAGRP